LRVIGGACRGMKLFSPPNDSIRPTTDRVREDIFNIINVRILDSDFLDLYAGTGAVSIEALSRGAKTATLVENSKDAIQLITKNAEKARVENYTIIRNNVKRYLCNSTNNYDIIFLDPPYGTDEAIYSIQKVAERGFLRADGLLVAEIGAQDSLPDHIDGLTAYRKKKYHSTQVLFYRYEA